MTAVASDPNGGQQYLESKSDEKLTGSTPASRFMAAHKGATWKVVPVAGFGLTGAEGTSPNYCLALTNICIVTVEIDAGSPAYFHFAVENRYSTTPPWLIIGVDEATSPTDGLPTGNSAHSA